jgi:hypothetical protein
MTMANAIKKRHERRQATRAALARDGCLRLHSFSPFCWIQVMGQRTPDVQGRPSASGSPATADLSIPPYSVPTAFDILNVHKLLFCFKLQPKKPWSTAIDHL